MQFTDTNFAQFSNVTEFMEKNGIHIESYGKKKADKENENVSDALAGPAKIAQLAGELLLSVNINIIQGT